MSAAQTQTLPGTGIYMPILTPAGTTPTDWQIYDSLDPCRHQPFIMTHRVLGAGVVDLAKMTCLGELKDQAERNTRS